MGSEANNLKLTTAIHVTRNNNVVNHTAGDKF
jgi:hypothetical protein